MIIGIDPGMRGGIAAVDKSTGDLVYAIDVPLIGDARQRYISGVRLRRYALDPAITAVLMERVWARPGESPSNSFRYGDSNGGLRLSFEMLNRVDLVLPVKWKATFDLPGGPVGKDMARRLAAELWPNNARLFSRKRDSGKADAALIAEHHRRQLEKI